MAISNTKIFGFADQVIQLMEDNKEALGQEGLDVTNKITKLDGLKDTAVGEAQKQDEMETASKIQTKVSQTSSKKCYDETSTTLDAVIGVLGKTTPAGKQAAKIRSSMIKQYKKKPCGDS